MIRKIYLHIEWLIAVLYVLVAQVVQETFPPLVNPRTMLWGAQYATQQIAYYWGNIVFVLTCWAIALPCWILFAVTVLPIRLCYSLADRYALESYIKFFGGVLCVVALVLLVVDLFV